MLTLGKKKSFDIPFFEMNSLELTFICRFVYVAQRQPEWLAMLTIFQPTTWIVFCLIMVLSAVTWYFLGRAMPETLNHKNLALCTLNSWAVFLGVSTTKHPRWNPLRIFFLTLALYGINVTTVYTSKLIKVFTRPPFDDQIDTIEEIVESHLPIGK